MVRVPLCFAWNLGGAVSCSSVLMGRRADGNWGLWDVNYGSRPYPLGDFRYPGMVCSDGDQLNVRAEASTSSSVVGKMAHGTVLKVDRFVLTDSVPFIQLERGKGWFHVVSPVTGWVYSDFVGDMMGATDPKDICPIK